MNEIESLPYEREALDTIAAVDTHEVIDGYVVGEDGEIIDVVPPLPVSQLKPVFRIDNTDAAAWVMEKMLDVDCAIVGIDRKMRAIIDNMESERSRQWKRREWLLKRFSAELEQFAKSNLVGRSRTWSCPFGKIAFRKTQPGIEIVDETAALVWLKTVMPSAVKVQERILLSECKEALLADPPPPGHGIEVKTAGESCKISTGV